MASIEEEIIRTLSLVENTVQRAISYIDEEINTMVEIPPLEDIKNPNQLYNGYRTTVTGYQKICDSVATLSQTQIRLRQLRRQMNSSNILPSTKSSLKNRIETTLGDIDLCRQSALVIKDGYDARLRFYGSTQYMLSSARYNEVNY